MKILEVQKNIFVLAHACSFLTTFVESHTEETVRKKLKEELLNYGIEVIYAVILFSNNYFKGYKI